MTHALPPIERLLAVMARLRDPVRGCPWDQVQTFATIAPYTIEEAYEVADAIERGDLNDLQQEIAQFLAEVIEIAARDRVRYLIGLLDRVGRDRRKILLEVPGAAGHRRAQRRHDLDQTGNVAGRGHCGAVSWLQSLMPTAARRSQRGAAEQADFHRLAADWRAAPAVLKRGP